MYKNSRFLKLCQQTLLQTLAMFEGQFHWILSADSTITSEGDLKSIKIKSEQNVITQYMDYLCLLRTIYIEKSTIIPTAVRNETIEKYRNMLIKDRLMPDAGLRLEREALTNLEFVVACIAESIADIYNITVAAERYQLLLDVHSVISDMYENHLNYLLPPGFRKKTRDPGDVLLFIEQANGRAIHIGFYYGSDSGDAKIFDLWDKSDTHKAGSASLSKAYYQNRSGLVLTMEHYSLGAVLEELMTRIECLKSAPSEAAIRTQLHAIEASSPRRARNHCTLL